MKTINPREQYDALMFEYEAVALENWTTEDLEKLYSLIDVELQERAFRAEFKSPFENIADDDC